MGVEGSAVLQALWIGLAIQMIISVVFVLRASLWKFMKERMPCPPGREVNAEPADLEMGTMNGGQGIDHPGVADYDDAHHVQGNDLEVRGDRSNQQDAHVCSGCNQDSMVMKLSITNF